MSIDIPRASKYLDNKETVMNAFRTEQGSHYVPERSADGRVVYRRHKYDGTDHEPRDLTAFITGMTDEEHDLLLHVTHKDSSRLTPDYRKQLEPFIAVIMQEQADNSYEGEVIRDVHDLRDGATSFLVLMELKPEGDSELCFAKELSFSPNEGSTVVEFRSSASKGFMVPAHIGHKVV
jgi:hypothetical protein